MTHVGINEASKYRWCLLAGVTRLLLMGAVVDANADDLLLFQETRKQRDI